MPFVAKLNNSGTSLLYSTFVPLFQLWYLAIDGQGNAYVSGRSLQASTPAFVFKNAAQSSCTPTAWPFECAAMIKFDGAGAVQYATYVGNPSEPNGLTVLPNGNPALVIKTFPDGTSTEAFSLELFDSNGIFSPTALGSTSTNNFLQDIGEPKLVSD